MKVQLQTNYANRNITQNTNQNVNFEGKINAPEGFWTGAHQDIYFSVNSNL